MYLPAHFAQHDTSKLHALMREHPLATLVTVGPDGPTADHVPLEFDAASNTLRGHVARANPLWQAAAGQQVLAVFSGPQAYVTPSWYPTKAVTHQVVPTWNYTVVHAHGRLRAVEDAPWVHALITRLTDEHETGRLQPWAVTDAPEDFVHKLLRAIVGIEIPVDRLVGKWKVTQNRSQADRLGVADGLAAEPRPEARALAPIVRGD